MRSFRAFFISFVLICVLLVSGIASAESPATLKGMKLSETKITLNTDMAEGDAAKIIVPQFTDNGDGPIANQKLHLFSTDENVVRVVNRSQDEENPHASINLIAAEGKGTAKVFAYSDDWKYTATLTVTVNGAASSNEQAYTSGWKNPGSKDLAKVKDPGLKAFFTLLGKKDLAKTANYYAGAEEVYSYQTRDHQYTDNDYKYQPIPTFKTIITLAWPKGMTETPEEKKAEITDRIYDHRMDQVSTFSLIDAISVTGTALQYKEILEDQEIGPYIAAINEDPISYAQSGADMPEGQAESLSHFSYADTLFGEDGGLTGDGTVIAFLDTGIDAGHEQFEGKIRDDACFSSYVPTGETHGVCRGTWYDEETGESWPDSAFSGDTSLAADDDLAWNSEFGHGTADAAAAAGKNGIARNAEIISYNVFSFKNMWYWRTDVDEDGTVHSYYRSWPLAVSYASDQMRAMEHLLDRLNDEEDELFNANVVALNMSLGGGKETKACTADIREPYFKAFLEKGIIPVAASGTNGYDGAVAAPACSPSVFAVGALWDSADPEVAEFSNHSALVNIMAPGTQIHSASVYADYDEDTEEFELIRDYENSNGTSLAAAMVSGAIAQMREFFPTDEMDDHYMSAVEVETLLTGMATKTAVRKVKVPVLDLGILSDVVSFIFDPFSHQGVFGGNKFLQMSFKQIPFNTQYKIQVWEANKTTGVWNEHDDHLEKTGKNLLSYKFTGLENDKLYFVRAVVDITFGKETFRIYQNGRLGMPMVIPTAKEAAAQYTIDVIHPDNEDEDPQFRFNGPVNGDEGYWAIWASAVDDHVDTADNNDPIRYARWDRPVTAEFHKTKELGFPNDSERCAEDPSDEDACGNYTVYSIPVISVDAFPIRKPMYPTNWRVDYGRVWLSYEDPEQYITAREIQVNVLAVDENGDPLRDPNTDELVVAKALKPVKADTKKFPNDIVITGVPDNVPVQVKVKATGTFNKKTYESLEWTMGYDEIDDQGETIEHYIFSSWTPEYVKEYEEYPMFSSNISGVEVTAGDKNAVVTYTKDLTLDGMRFEIKPIDPNHTKLVQEATMAKNPTSYTISGLTNGTAYKLRMQQTLKAGKGTVRSTFFPGKWYQTEEGYWDQDYNPRREDTAWDGIIFIPLAAPQVTYRNDSYGDNTRRELVVKGDKSADGFVIVEVGFDPDTHEAFTSAETYHWTDWKWDPNDENWDFEDGQSFWMNNVDDRQDNPGYSSGILSGDNATLSHVVMLFKVFDDGFAKHIYYGPAAYLNPINQLPGQDDYPNYISTGAKTVDAIDLLSIPELADAAQIDGKVFGEFTESGIEAKNIAEAKEIRLVEDFAVETDEEIPEEEEAAEIEAAEVPEEDEFEEYPEIISEGLDAEDPMAEKAVEPEDAADEAEELEEDEFESYPEILYLDLEEDAEEAEPETESEPEPVKTPAPKKQEKKENGFSLFMFGN